MKNKPGKISRNRLKERSSRKNNIINLPGKDSEVRNSPFYSGISKTDYFPNK